MTDTTNEEHEWAVDEARVELARLIRAGHLLIAEDHKNFLAWAERFPQRVCGCALGAAWVAYTGIVSGDYPFTDGQHVFYLNAIEAEMPLLQVPIDRALLVDTVGEFWEGYTEYPTLGEVVNTLHQDWRMPRLDIAHWLETGEFVKREQEVQDDD